MRRVEGFGARERDAYWGGMRASSREPTAPIKLQIEAVLLAIEATIETTAGETLAAAVCAMPLSWSLGKLRSELQRRRARDLGLTADTAPQLKVGWEWALLGVGRLVWLRLRGLKRAAPSWTSVFAQSLIREIDRRVAWQRALQHSALPGTRQLC
jgi:hypothetical protein